MYEGCRDERRTDRQLVVEVKGMDVGDRLKNFRWPRLPFIRYIWPSFVKYGLRDFFFFHAGCQEQSDAVSYQDDPGHENWDESRMGEYGRI